MMILSNFNNFWKKRIFSRTIMSATARRSWVKKLYDQTEYRIYMCLTLHSIQNMYCSFTKYITLCSLLYIHYSI